MSKLPIIIKREFVAKVRNKSFIVMTFLSPLLMVGIGFLVYFLSKKNNEKVKNIAYVDYSKIFTADDFKDKKTVRYEDYSDLTLEEAKKKVEEGDFYGMLHIPQQDSLELLVSSIEFYSESTPSVQTIEALERKIEKRLRERKLKNLDIDVKQLESADFNASIKLNNFSGEKSSKMSSWIKLSIDVGEDYWKCLSRIATVLYLGSRHYDYAHSSFFGLRNRYGRSTKF